MGLFSKKADPISERSRALKEEIAALESQIRALSEQAEPVPTRSHHNPPPAPAVTTASPAGKPERSPRKIPVQEFKLEADPLLAPELNINLDKPGFLSRMVEVIRGKPTANPKLVTFLAAGSIQGLRPLRYEKRIARNRFILLSAVFLLILWALLAQFVRNS